MNTFTFKAKNKDKTLSGTLIVRKNKTDILFDGDFDLELNGFVDSELNETNIKDKANFIASYIKRIDKNELFNEIIINGVNTPILREEKNKEKTMKVFYLGEIKEQVFFKEQDITILDINSKKIKINTFDVAKFRTVPLDFNYSKNSQLNKILAFNLVSHDYKRNINSLLLKALKTINSKMKIKKNVNYLYMTAEGALTENENAKHFLIIPRTLW